MVGGLGESSSIAFKSNLRRMFGDWIVDEDGGVDSMGPRGVDVDAEGFFNFGADDDEAEKDEEPYYSPTEVADAKEHATDDLFGSEIESPFDPFGSEPEPQVADVQKPRDDCMEMDSMSYSPEGPDNEWPDNLNDYFGFDTGDPYDIDLTRASYINGPHHIQHDCTEMFGSVLVDWSWAIDILKHICRLISNRGSKQRLLETCFSSGPQVIYASKIRSFYQRVYTKRWGTVLAAVKNLIALYDALLTGWSQQHYTNGQNIQGPEPAHAFGDEEHGQADLDVVNAGINSAKFWGTDLNTQLNIRPNTILLILYSYCIIILLLPSLLFLSA